MLKIRRAISFNNKQKEVNVKEVADIELFCLAGRVWYQLGTKIFGCNGYDHSSI